MNAEVVKKFYPREPDKKGAAKFSFIRRSDDNIKAKPVPKHKLKKWKIGEKSQGYAKTKFHTRRIRAQEEVMEAAAEKSARAEVLCVEEQGGLDTEDSHLISQADIKRE